MIRIKVSLIPLCLDHLHDKVLTLLVTHPILATISCSINQSAWTARSFSWYLIHWIVFIRDNVNLTYGPVPLREIQDGAEDTDWYVKRNAPKRYLDRKVIRPSSYCYLAAAKKEETVGHINLTLRQWIWIYHLQDIVDWTHLPKEYLR